MGRPRKYDDETRDRAVRMVLDRMAEGESTLASREHVGHLLGISPGTLRHWMAEPGQVTRASASPELADEVEALRKENAELRRANDILKSASAFFAQAELDRRLL